MLWPKEQVERRGQEILEETGLTREQIPIKATAGQVQTLTPDSYKRFGPWWPRVRALMLKYQGDKADFCQEWGGDPDFLAHYTYSDDFLDLVAAFDWRDQDGDFWDVADRPHKIVLADGSRALYSPDIGLVETD